MSTHDKLYASLFYLGFWSPAAAIIFAGLLYDRNSSRGSLVAYLGISVICAFVGFVLGAALGIASACSLYGGGLCPIVGIAFGPFGSALAIVLAAGWWRKAGSWRRSVAARNEYPITNRDAPHLVRVITAGIYDRRSGADRMSALGHKRTLTSAWAMSALPPKADMDRQGCDVRFVPKADICKSSTC